MSNEILKQVVDELAAIRELLTKVLDTQQESQELADTKAEADMVEAMGLDPVAYLKDKCRKNRSVSKPSKKPAAARSKGSAGPGL
jgi:hypothetical protein